MSDPHEPTAASNDVDPPPHALVALRARVEPILREQIETHPYRTLGAAFLVGFALGGGLSSRLARYGLLVAARYALRAVWRDVLVTALDRASASLPVGVVEP